MGNTSRARYARRAAKPPHELTPRQLYCLRQIALIGECSCATGTRTSLIDRDLIAVVTVGGPRHPTAPLANWRLTTDGEKAVAHWVGKRPEWEPNRLVTP
jgi:hypothetical protein